MVLSNPVDRKGIEKAFRDALKEATGIEWVRARQRSESPRPARPFGTYWIMSLDSMGATDEVVVVDEGSDVAMRNVGLRRGVLSCNVYGSTESPDADPAVYCDRAVSAFAFEFDALNQQGVAVHDISSVKPLDALENTQYEQRSQFDVTFSVRSDVKKVVGYLETVEISALDEEGNAIWPNPQTFSLIEE